MVYTNIRAIMKWWDTQTKKLKCCSSAKFDEHKNKFGKGWLPGSEIMIGTNTSTLTTLNIDLSDHPFVKNDIFEVNVNFPPGGTPIVIVAQYYEYHNMSFISHSINNSPWNHALPARNRTNAWIFSIGRK